MPLRLVSKDRTHVVTVHDAKIHIKSMTIGDKERLVRSIQSVSTTGDPGEDKFKRLIGIIADAIVKVEGMKESPTQILEQLEDVNQLRDIVKSIIDHCDLTPSEVKNLPSSPEQLIPESAGNVVKPVVPDDAPASTT